MVACSERRIDIGSALERIDRRNTLEFNSFIGVSYIQDLSVCDELIDFFERHPQYKFAGTVSDRFDDQAKKSTEISFRDISSDLKQKYYDELKKVSDEYISNYYFCDVGVQPWGIVEPGKIQKYLPGEGFYKWHTERTSSIFPYCNRHLVYMTYLNDVTDAGETEFFHQQVKVRPKKGLTLIWPADWTHTHRGITSPTQTKYIVTGWYSFAQPH
jgi:hypothetical protein